MAWDYVLSKGDPYWVIVTLKDGGEVAGFYGKKSFASSSPESQDIYLEERWEMNGDGGLERLRTDSGGVLVAANQIRSIEFFRVNELES